MGDGPGEFVLVILITVATVFAIASAGDNVLSGSVLTITALVSGLVLFGRLWVANRAPINWPPSEWSTSARLLAMLLGLRVLDCGCAYVPHRHRHRTRLPDYEAVESDRFWVQHSDGAKWRYELWQEQFVRCENCGRHRYRRKPMVSETSFASDPDRSVWKDEEQPTFEHEVRDAEFVETSQ